MHVKLHDVVLVLSAAIYWCSADVTVDLKQRLKYFEVMHTLDVSRSLVRNKRSLSQPGSFTEGIQEVKFATLGRKFHLYLTHDRSIFAPGFEAVSVGADGVSRPIVVDPDVFLIGHVAGEESSASLRWEGEALNAKIVTATETYYIEPSWPHLPSSLNYTMLTYKGSDLRGSSHKETGGFCSGVRAPQPSILTVNGSALYHGGVASGSGGTAHNMRKRSDVQPNNACHLYIVADYKFYTQIANSDETRAVNYMIDLVSRVDKIYRRTKWSDNLVDMGFTIKKLLVHDSWSSDKGSYNVQTKAWDVNGLLDAFSEVSHKKELYNHYCLAHLFTGYSFSNGVLGLAYIASPQTGALGGICSSTYYNPSASKDYYLNTGWSSAMNKAGNKILTQEAEIVLAHELGHNWGSEHDPATSQCSPSSSDGKYIMYTYAVSGFDPNNVLFSPCSQSSISQVLSTKSRRCFQVRLDSVRGNYRVDEGEECDAGIVGNACCGSNFKLIKPASCCDTNDVCCTNCSISNAANKKCRIQSELTCEATAVCDGKSKTCPLVYSAAGTRCLPDGSGRCLRVNSTSAVSAAAAASGAMYCTQFCEVLGLLSCSCTDVIHSCHVCCRANRTAACLPYEKRGYRNVVQICSQNKSRECLKFPLPAVSFEPFNYLNDSGNIILREDTPCIYGYCSGTGVCIKQSQDQLTRFWDFITHLTPSAIVQFMEDNVVGTIIVLSLVVWLPVSIAVACIDRKREQNERERDAIASTPWTGTLTRVRHPSQPQEVSM